MNNRQILFILALFQPGVQAAGHKTSRRRHTAGRLLYLNIYSICYAHIFLLLCHFS